MRSGVTPTKLQNSPQCEPFNELSSDAGVVDFVDDLQVQKVSFEVRVAVAMTWLRYGIFLLFHALFPYSCARSDTEFVLWTVEIHCFSTRSKQTER